ncbi:MAG: hypothetical protein JWP47_847 [Polaromonas sp.]|nr:hypothetical protein [Polaromonas sp.]
MTAHNSNPDKADGTGHTVDYSLPPDVRRFLVSTVDSIPFLEALLLLHGNPQEVWTGEKLSRRLYIAEPAALELLQGAVAAGIAIREPTGLPQFRYQAASRQLQVMLDELALTYSRNLMAVTQLVHAKTDARSKRARQFADAFRWKKDT